MLCHKHTSRKQHPQKYYIWNLARILYRNPEILRNPPEISRDCPEIIPIIRSSRRGSCRFGHIFKLRPVALNCARVARNCARVAGSISARFFGVRPRSARNDSERARKAAKALKAINYLNHLASRSRICCTSPLSKSPHKAQRVSCCWELLT